METEHRTPNTAPLPCAGLDWGLVRTPCTVVDLDCLRANLRELDAVRRRTGARVLLALKGFAMFGVFDELRPFLDGVCASSPHEARLGAEEFRGEVHAYAPAYSDEDLADLLRTADHIVFNSFAQWRRHGPRLQGAARRVEVGLRVNPGYSEVATALYDPCAPGSRLGIPAAQFEGQSLAGLDGLHFHALCEQTSEVLERVLARVEAQFGRYFPPLKWVNFGGGHHITRPGYNGEHLCALLTGFRARHPHLQVYLEPGEAVALGTGVLVATVLDVVHNAVDIAILDTSAAAHMPDVLEMPYRPAVRGAGEPGQFAHTYRLGGLTCLAGDIVGDYSFPAPLHPGSRIVFEDMAHYTMVKSTTFNGVRLPSIATYEPSQQRLRYLRHFGYEDYRGRLS